MNKLEKLLTLIAIGFSIFFLGLQIESIRCKSTQTPQLPTTSFPEAMFKNAYNKGVTNGVIATANSLMVLMIKDKSLTGTFTTQQIIEIQNEGVQAAAIH